MDTEGGEQRMRFRSMMAAGLVVAATVAGSTSAAASPWGYGRADVARYRQHVGTPEAPTRVVLKCGGWQEDDVAGWRTVSYEGERYVLRCIHADNL